MATTRMSFSYPQDMKERLQSLAKRDCRTLSSYIQRILSEHLEAAPSKKGRHPPKKKVVRKGKRASTT